MSRTRKSVERENTLAVARGQGLDLTDRVPEELWMECTGGRDQDHPQENKMQKGKTVV